MDLLSDGLKAEVLLTVSNTFRFLVGLEKIKAVPGKKAGYLVILESVGDKVGSYIETLSTLMGQPSDLISVEAGVGGLLALAKRNGWVLTYHQDLVSSWQKREPGVCVGGAIKFRRKSHDGMIFSFSSSGTSTDSIQAEFNDEAVILCAAKGLGLIKEDEVQAIVEASQNNVFGELWAAWGR